MKRYSAYKDSGIEWVGEMPDRWSTKPLFAVFKERHVPNDGNQEDNVLSLSYGRIIRRDVDSNFGLLPESFETYNIVDPLNIVLRLTDLQNDKRSLRCGLVQEKGIITSAYLTLEKKADIDPKYMYYLLHNYDIWKVFYSMGGGVRQSIKFDALKRLPILLPSLEEQEKIASYLDSKMGQIDGLIDKKERQIELLKEERVAIINQAVTKGLNPRTEMRDSGVEWIGNIPRHWELRKISRSFDYIGSGTTPDSLNQVYYDGGTIPWVITGDLNDGFLVETSKKITELAIKDYSALKQFPRESILIAMYGATIGKSAIVNFAGCCNQACCVLNNSKYFLNEFVLYWFVGNKQNIISLGLGGGQPNISQDVIKGLKMPCPPRNEQQQIVDYLSQKVSKIDDQAIREQKVIEQLREYRTSLISEVVTGKIDVREIAA